jgi:hypothetical protein
MCLDLGDVPASDAFPRAEDPGPDPTFPLELYACSECHLLQLGPAATLHPETPTAVDSATAMAHAASSVAQILAEEGLGPGATISEFDSGHGASWLPAFQAAGLVIADGERPSDLVADVHHLMHAADLDEVLAHHARRLATNGVMVCEFFHALPMVAGSLIDTIRHGHYLYLSLTAALPALARHGLVPTRVTRVPAYGGSLRLAARRAGDAPAVDQSVGEVLEAERAAGLAESAVLAEFGRRGRQVADTFRSHLQDLREEGLRVAGYGAPSKAPVLLALAGVDRSLLPYTVDLSAAKHGRRIPTAGVPIQPVEILVEDKPDVVVVLTWDIAEEVASQLRASAEGTDWRPRLYQPLPMSRTFRWDAGDA